MKFIKISKFLGAAFVLTLCFFGGSTQTSAYTDPRLADHDEDEISNYSNYYSMYVEVQANYGGNLGYPSTINYNLNGYSGVLRMIKVTVEETSMGTQYSLVYGGVVTCTGVCVAPSSIIEQE